MSTTDEAVLDAWRINARVTGFLVERLPARVWDQALPGSPRRTVRSLSAHLHNARRLWLRGLGVGAGIRLPAAVDPRRVTQHELVRALEASGRAILALLEAGLANGGDFPGVKGPFYFGAMPRDAALFVAYATAHEAHHRGQLVMAARALGCRLPASAVAGLWQWSSRLHEARAGKGR
jgi:uncharacterized damage-inducible protein DinB